MLSAPEWRNGRRSRLKPGSRKAWGFESLLRHQCPGLFVTSVIFSPETDVALRMRAVLVTGARELRPGARFVRIDVRQSGQTAPRTSAA